MPSGAARLCGPRGSGAQHGYGNTAPVNGVLTTQSGSYFRLREPSMAESCPASAGRTLSCLTAVPRDLELHLVLGNYATCKTPAIHQWLLEHPRFRPAQTAGCRTPVARP